ncbi:MAG: amino acid permease [Chlorogloeopsis fritschii C42_A2020_084]|uniref:APC family permease n=1 Tax=Chlorogloeopsis fritschii TaxID=1124 RepID=UPI0019F03CD0|nr:amino acid permease [Chlorogloeopsis fritschii]MBF2006355.1 amino acid permease [Chlorogloeopsis fritschii C42_A2020_084]
MNRREDYAFVKQGATTEVASPKPSLTFFDAVALIVGIVIGAGIFETPAVVAANTGNGLTALLLWLAGGLISLIGALCYAELATTYPDVGGTYYYLKRAFGLNVAFLFAWARMTVIQTGSITLLAFIFGDYLSEVLRLGNFSSSLYAAAAIALLTALNILGLQQGKWMQNWLTAVKVLGLLLVIGIGIAVSGSPAAPSSPPPPTEGTWGLAMLFVLLSYGGWNEAAFISAEIQNRRRNILRSLIWSIGIITAIYLLINVAYLRGLGLAQMAQSQAVAAALMRNILGQPGAIFISLLIAVSALGAINATIFTGARTNYALGQDFSLFGFMGHWQQRSSAPTFAYLLQGAIALVLVLLGTFTRRGFETMVDYTAPVFWFFFLLSGISLFVLRRREPNALRPFRVPFYPITPLLFCLVCGYLLYSSLAYTNVGAIVGVVVVAAGIPFLLWNQHRYRRT